MPTVPVVHIQTPGNTADGVRANPGMYDSLGEAGQRLGRTVSGIGSELGSLSARVKHATDTSYVIQSQTKLEAAQTEFKAWTEQNPDTSSWKSEFAARTKPLIDDIQKNGSSLGRMAQLELKTHLNAWQIRSNAGLDALQTKQNILNSQGIAQEGITQAIAGNDSIGAAAIIDTAVSQGVMHPSVGAAMRKRVTTGIATNLANADMGADPFTMPYRLDEKGEDGKYVNYPGLPEAARQTMKFRSSKLANEVRTNSLRTWQQQIADAQENGTAMPDREGVEEEARREGIAPKTIAKLFAPPAKTFDKASYASAQTEIHSLDLVNDPDGSNMARAMELVTSFKGPAQERLNKLVTEISDPNAPTNRPVGSFGKEQLKSAFELGLYGKFKEQDLKTGKDVVIPSAYSKASTIYAQNLSSLQEFLNQHPNATQVDVQKFINGLHTGSASQQGANLVTSSLFGFPKK